MVEVLEGRHSHDRMICAYVRKSHVETVRRSSKVAGRGMHSAPKLPANQDGNHHV